MNKQIIGYYFIRDLGDGDAEPEFFLDQESCVIAQETEEQEYGYVIRGTTPVYQEDFK